MIAMSVMLGSIYDYDVSFNGVQIWLQSFLLGKNMTANIEIFLLTRFVQKWGLEVLSEIALIFFSLPEKIILQFAIIFEPQRD